jgi:hypothetical protein
MVGCTMYKYDYAKILISYYNSQYRIKYTYMLAASSETLTEGTSIETNFPEIINYKHTLYST